MRLTFKVYLVQCVQYIKFMAAADEKRHTGRDLPFLNWRYILFNHNDSDAVMSRASDVALNFTRYPIGQRWTTVDAFERRPRDVARAGRNFSVRDGCVACRGGDT